MRSSILVLLLAAIATLVVAALIARGEAPEKTPRGPFGLSLVTTSKGKPARLRDFAPNEECATCHARQHEEMNGSFHSFAHEDRFYRLFAERARAEAGEELYGLCSGCHTAAGVVTGLVPGTPEADLPAVAKAGVTCDVCHQISKMTGPDGPWGEPGNASFVLEPGYVKFGAEEDVGTSPTHEGEGRAFYETSEYCANCHTIIHPTNGLRIEHTYAEWKGSDYAEKGIQCQDCHMRSVADAREVARTMKPISRRGRYVVGGQEREIAPHVFVGGNSNAHRLGGKESHSAMARERLKSAAEIAIREAKAGPDGTRAFEVVVRNVGAGHNLPTSLTEIREMWVEVKVTTATGEPILHQGALDARGEIPEGAIRFGAVMEDAGGKVTVKPWEGVRFRSKRLVPPKGEDVTRVELPGATAGSGELVVEARLLYRSAAPHVVKMIMKEEAFEMEVVEMTTVRHLLPSR